MGYLVALFVGFAFGWLSAALFISGSRVKGGIAAGEDTIDPEVGSIF